MNSSSAETYVFIATGVTVLVALVGFIIYFIFIYRNKQLHNIRKRREMEIKFEKEIVITQLEIQEQTLKNISQEIHDNIGQVLSLVKLNLATVNLLKVEEAKQKIDDSKDLVAKAIQDLRDISKSLNTDYVAQMGFARSVGYELELLKKTGSFNTTFNIYGAIYKLDQQKELILFRIVQEVLNNIIKHTKASLISVEISYEPESFLLTIHDNGQGFDLNKIKVEQYGNTGLGIKNMHNRASMVGATFLIKSTIGEGTTVQIQIQNQTVPHNNE